MITPGRTYTTLGVTQANTGGIQAADSLPTGTLYRNAVATAETVTVAQITGGRYSVSFAIPDTWPVGDVVDVLFEATVGGITGGGVVFTGTLGMLQSVVQTITTRDPGNRVGSPATLEMFRHDAKTFSLTVQDGAGDSVDLTGRTLRFVVIDGNHPHNDVFDVEAGGITITGKTSEVANVTVSTSQSDLPDSTYVWRLRDVTSAATLAHGQFVVRASSADVA